jgi:hypothetical protein
VKKTRISDATAVLAAFAALSTLGCLGDPAQVDELELTRMTGALDNQVDPDEGKTCYQDVPPRKGKMELGMCCFDDPIKGTSTCVACDKEHTCTIGGAEPGALVAGTRGLVWDDSGGVLDGAVTTAPSTADQVSTPLIRASAIWER